VAEGNLILKVRSHAQAPAGTGVSWQAAQGPTRASTAQSIARDRCARLLLLCVAAVGGPLAPGVDLP